VPIPNLRRQSVTRSATRHMTARHAGRIYPYKLECDRFRFAHFARN
jgi:hypothetical protein